MIALRNAIDIAFDDVGSGLPVVFLHGFLLDRSLWTPQFGAHVDHNRCIALDLRGFGGSTPAPPYTVEQYADDVIALLDVLGIERAVIVGLSLGGYVAFALWRNHRRRVMGLVLANTRASADSEDTRARRRALIAVAHEGGSRAVADAQINMMVGASTRAKHPALVDGIHHMLERAPVAGIVGALEAMAARPDAVPLLATIDVPTLIIAGDEDAVIPVAEARAMHEAVPGSTFELLAGSGHLSNLERPAAFNHVVAEFLARLACD